MKIQQLINELKRRNVFKVASYYAVTAWLLIQIAATTFPMFELPEWAPRFVVIFAIIGFPIALILAWAYDVVPETKLDPADEMVEDKQEEQAAKPIKWQTPVLVVSIGILGFLIGSFRKQGTNNTPLLPKEVRMEKVAVAVFNNFTNQPELDALGNMASDWISLGLRELGVKTTSPEMMRRYKDRVGILPNDPDGEASLLELTDAQYVVTGSYYQKGDSLQITSRLESTETGDNIYDFPVIWGTANKKEQLIEDIREKLKGYWALKKVQRVSNVNPPKYEAYQAFLKCGMIDYECQQEVLAIDSTFLLSRIYLAFAASQYEDDSLYQAISTYVKEHWDRCTEFEQNYFLFVENRRTGNDEAALAAIKNNLALDPKDLDIVHYNAYGYLELNQPSTTVEVLAPFFDQYEIFKDRIRAQSIDAYFFALCRSGQAKEVLAFVQEHPEYEHWDQAMRALMLEGEWEEVQRHLPSLPKWQYLRLTHMFNAIAPADRDNIFAPLLRANLEQFKDPTPGWNYFVWSHVHLYNWDSKAFAYYQLKEWKQAEEILLELRNIDWETSAQGSIPPTILANIDPYMNTWREGLLGSTYARQGKTNLAHVQIEQLESFRANFPGTLNRFHRGVISYWQARIHGVLGEKAEAVARLAQSMEEGRRIDYANFDYDWDLVSLKGYPPYEDLIKPRE